MLYALALLIVATLVFAIIRAGATALEMTGLSRDAARFQALSAFFGAGFTTGESEMVVNHPVRRRIIRDLIVIGNIGILSAVGTVVVTAGKLDFGHDPETAWLKVIVVIIGLLGLWLVSKTRVPTWLIDRSVSMMLRKTGILHAMDYEALLRVRSGYAVEEFLIGAGHWLRDRTLKEVKPRDFGVNVLGVVRAGGDYIGTPHGDTAIGANDTLILYGEHDAVSLFLSGEPQPETKRDSAD